MKKDDAKMGIIIAIIGIAFGIGAWLVKSMVLKWILGIICIGLICFAIYGSIQAYVIEKKNKEARQKAFMERFNHISDQRNMIFNGQRPNDEDFGYTETNPVATSTIGSEEEYLGRLRSEDGTRFTWDRLGSQFVAGLNGSEGSMVDTYQLFLNGDKYKIIYICPYGHDSDYCPSGMKLS